MKCTFFPIILMSIVKPDESIICLKPTTYMHIYLNYTDIKYFKVYFTSCQCCKNNNYNIPVFSQLELKGNLSISFLAMRMLTILSVSMSVYP